MINTKKTVAEFLRKYACQYHKSDFIQNDPVQFPHRYTSNKDIEISGFLTAILSFGSRPQILKAADRLDVLMGGTPWHYVMSGQWRTDFCGKESFYRTLSKDRVGELFAWLHAVYSEHGSMEDALLAERGTPMERLCSRLEVSAKSPQKKLNMFLRWMIRRESEVDFGIWTSFSPRELIIPLDTHVSEMAFRLELTQSKSYTLNNAKRITATLLEIFPEDPCLGDFALFGYGVNEL